ncbi:MULTISPECIES: hypothetical protein [Ramlibacter]|uniref:Uncharacterized protein n=1 Tax=Ramlibacter aquaticus TaxID=2780094 RepID=A0ABR9SBX0_9BURK|nr:MULTISPECIES: hypothetical protein [Ramlibacter]MBE7939800.1 hypothetical protein [Ramlibacter aquaticus]
MNLDQLQRIRRWHAAHRSSHPVECQAWDAMLTLWVIGWVGWVPACILGSFWSLPVLVAAMSAPSLYAAWRLKAHRLGRLRCDWVGDFPR